MGDIDATGKSLRVSLTAMRASREHGSEHRAFLEATLPHLDAVWNVARRSAPDAASAEDLLQETYLRAYRAFASQGSGEMRSWLVAICLNTARSEHRRRSRRPLEVGLDDQGAPTCIDDADFATISVDRWAVAAALAELPDPQRVAIVMVDLGGLSAADTAARLGVPRGTVLARVHRGRRRLAVLLERQGLGHV